MGFISAYRTARLEASIVNDIKLLRKSLDEASLAARRNALLLDIGKLMPLYRTVKGEEVRAEALEYTGSVVCTINPKYGERLYDRGLDIIATEIPRFNKGGYTEERFLEYKKALANAAMFPTVPIKSKKSK